MLKPAEVLDREPLVKKDELRGGGYYVEYKTDDARLTIEVLKKKLLKMVSKQSTIQKQWNSSMKMEK